LRRTWERRPELLESAQLDEEERRYLQELKFQHKSNGVPR
jgi:hypothetical protein